MMMADARIGTLIITGANRRPIQSFPAAAVVGAASEQGDRGQERTWGNHELVEQR